MPRLGDWVEPHPHGIYLPAADAWVDPSRPVPRALVTHGHADHARGGHGEVWATPETLAIMEVRYGPQVGRPVAYGESLDWHGPVPTGFDFGDGRVVVRFEAGAAALAGRAGSAALHGFSVAGQDRVFHPASARTEGATVVVQGDGVAAPVAVRYAWHDDASAADLANSAGLPASPFRSDDW